MTIKLCIGLTACFAAALWGQPQTVFTNVSLLQKAASPVLSSVGWKNLGYDGGYYGSSEIKLPSDGFVPSTVRYSISSPTANKVQKALISAFIASPGDLVRGKLTVQVAAAQWFKSVNKPIPAGLVAAIRRGAPFKGVADGVSVEYVVERGTGNAIKQPDGSSYRCTTMDLMLRPQ
jgi:hypothetical protein